MNRTDMVRDVEETPRAFEGLWPACSRGRHVAPDTSGANRRRRHCQTLLKHPRTHTPSPSLPPKTHWLCPTHHRHPLSDSSLVRRLHHPCRNLKRKSARRGPRSLLTSQRSKLLSPTHTPLPSLATHHQRLMSRKALLLRISLRVPRASLHCPPAEQTSQSRVPWSRC